jgi:hypothetical protein
MPSPEAKLAKDVLVVLLELFPLGAIAKSAVKLPIGYLFERVDNDSKAKSIASIAAAIANEISGNPDQDNPGSARSAAYDVVHIFETSQLGPSLLIELNLDAKLVLSHLMASGAPVLATASAQRQGFIKDGLRKLSETVVESAPGLPGVQLAFMQAMLKSRSAPIDAKPTIKG